MGGFINTQYFETQDKLTSLSEDLVKNPFYLFNDKKGTKVTYYNINFEKSTLDPGSKLAYAELGPESPIKYNKIEDVYLYQFNRVEFDFDDDEFGMSNVPIEGESYILPNTFEPVDGDYFEVTHLKKSSTWLFRVNRVQVDTFENGNNAYRINWKLETTTNEKILDRVVEEFHYVNIEDGTNLKSVVRSDKYEQAKKLDQLSVTLANYFVDLFYHKEVGTFIYKWYNMCDMYDPFAIEFIIRNKLLAPVSKKVIPMHMMTVPNTFSLDYNRSCWRAIENKDIAALCGSHYRSQADYIDDKSSIFATRYEAYFALNYNVYAEENGPLNPRDVIPILDEDIITRIHTSDKYIDETFWYKDILIAYFHDEELDYDSCIKLLEKCNFLTDENIFDKDVFYYLIILIFLIDNQVKKLLS